MKKGFNEKEVPFVKRLDSALQEIGVQRQQYFGGAFIGNHVHKALKYSTHTHGYCMHMNNPVTFSVTQHPEIVHIHL